MLNVNEYFAGKVKSIGFDSGSIGRQSIGVMDAGEYTFSTDKPEEMTVITGALRVLIPGAPDWQVFSVLVFELFWRWFVFRARCLT